jgi:hypothetical protein
MIEHEPSFAVTNWSKQPYLGMRPTICQSWPPSLVATMVWGDS